MEAELPDEPQMLGDFQMPSLEEMLKALEGMDTLDEKSKQELRESLLARANENAGGFIPPKIQQAAETGAPVAPDFVILMIFLTVIAMVFGVDHVEKPKLDPVVLKEKLDKLLTGLKDELGDEFVDKLQSLITRKVNYFAYVYLVCILILLAILVFFGYKLYKSLVERERRKEEKKRQKQQKKKK